VPNPFIERLVLLDQLSESIIGPEQRVFHGILYGELRVCHSSALLTLVILIGRVQAPSGPAAYTGPTVRVAAK
jgi:hypothetical protein